MRLLPWAATAAAILIGIALFFAGWIAAPNIREREIIGVVGMAVPILGVVLLAVFGREQGGGNG